MADHLPEVEPLDTLKNLLGRKVLIKCRNGRELKGNLHGYDEHLNVVLGNCEETQPAQLVKTSATIEKKVRNLPMIYMRGDQVAIITRIE